VCEEEAVAVASEAKTKAEKGSNKNAFTLR